MSPRLLRLCFRPTLVIASVLAAVALAVAAIGSDAAHAWSAPINPDSAVQSSFPDYDPSCSVFSNVSVYYDPYGYPFYEPVPIIGNPFALYSQCVNVCAPFYGYCVVSCPVPQQFSPYGVLVCPGPPDRILFAPQPDDVGCGSASNLELVILDANGLRVLDGTQVQFNTTLGYVSTTAGTSKGNATTSLTIPPKQAGAALITATAGRATAQKLVQVTCP
jgi:hypothetical protein